MNDFTTHTNTGSREGDPHESRRIMDAIRARDIRMRPRGYFMLRGILAVISTALLFIALLYFVSLFIYALHANGIWFAPDYGFSGWSLFLTALPWGLLVLSFVLMLVLAKILRQRYAFAYKRPLSYFLFAVIVIAAVGGFFLAATAFHPDLFQYATTNIPFLGDFYQYETALPASVHRGRIVSFTDDGFTIADGLGVTSSVTAAPGVVFIQDFHAGDVVLVFGTRDKTGLISAFGIQRIAVATSGPVR